MQISHRKKPVFSPLVLIGWNGQSILQGHVSAMLISEAGLNKCFLSETAIVNICNEWLYIGYNNHKSNYRKLLLHPLILFLRLRQ